jgi:uncharacterized protein YecE (DUF72 family)
VSDPLIRLGTCAFTANGWVGSFYPKGLKSADYLSWYADHFDTVEVDSTFYACPPPKTVSNWAAKTPENFVFSVKAPQVITHEKILGNCESEFQEFVTTMGLLRGKLGPIVFQFPLFDQWTIKDRHDFTDRLLPFLKKLPTGLRFAVEIRNKKWLDIEFADMLRQFKVALVLQDIHVMPLANEVQQRFDPVTADFSYVRFLGDRHGIERLTTTWDKVVDDKTPQLAKWVDFCQLVQKRGVSQYIYANNHYEGFGPATIEKFRNLWRSRDLPKLSQPEKHWPQPNLFD